MSNKPISAKVLEKLRNVDSHMLSNAIETFNVRDRLTGYAGQKIRCFYPELGTTIGFAVTAQIDRTSPYPATSKAPLKELAELVEMSPKPVVLVFQDIGPRPGYAGAFGSYGVAVMQRLGAVALVCDTAVMNVNVVRELGFQYFATGSVVSHGYPRILTMGVPVVVDGLYVRPGDLIHGDADGVLSVPLEIVDDLAVKATQMRAREQEEIRLARSEDFSLDATLKRMGW